MPATGIVFVRTDITLESDTPYEGPETFTLTASYTSGSPRSASGIATIIDNGTGSLYDGTFSNGSPIKPSGNLDDDRSALSIPDVNVNENSPYVVFQVSAQGGQQFSLALIDGAPGFGQANNTGTIDKQQAVKPNGSDTTGDYLDQIQVYNGTTWSSYVPGSLVTVPTSGSVLLVRVPLVDDAIYEGSHAFTLIATPANAGSPASGRAIIGDFGTGSIFNDSGAEDRKAPKDDDRALRVDSPIVNEGSEHVVFTVTGITGGPIQLQLQDTTGGTGFATLPKPTLEYWSGSAWLLYTGVGLIPGTDFPSGGTLSVRVAIGDEQDGIREGSERFSLVVSGIGGPSTGVATIRDDGTGLFWLEDALTPATPSQLTSAGKTLDDDFDLDGITPTTEEALATLAASQGFGSAPGDLNGDGIADALQNALATLAWRDVASFDAGNEGTLTDVKPVISLKALDDASGNSVSNTMQLQNIRVLDYNSSDEFGAAANAVSKDASTGQRKVTLVSGVTVNTPYDPIRFELTTQEGTSNLTDIFGDRDGLQVRMVIDMRAAQLDANEFNSYIKFVSQKAIDAAGATPLKDLQGNAITKEGWYDFTQRTENGDGARFIIEAGKIVAVELILTDNAFGDNDLQANRIFDPGVLVKASVPQPVPQPEAEAVDPVQSEEFIRPAIPLFTQFNANEKHGFSDEESFDSEFDFAIPKYELQGEWAMKAQFTKAGLATTALKGVEPERMNSPKAPVNEPPGRPPEGEGSLRNTLTPPDALAGAGGKVTYSLPEGTFMGGQGLVRLQATQRDGSPLPAWVQFDGATGKFNAQVPNNLVKPIEIKVEARDSNGGKAETVFKIQPRSDKLGFVGKQSLTAQIQNAIRLRA